jgi:hypothetical protein
MEREMADEAESPYELTDKPPEDWPTDGPSVDPQYIADRERDIRMCCVRAALDIHRPGETTAKAIVEDANQILTFLNGSAR